MTDRKPSWKHRAGAGALAVAMAGVLGAGAAFARPGGHGGRGGPGCGGHGLERLEERIEGLGLEKEAQTAVDGVLEQARAARKAQRSELREAREQMHALLEQDAPALEAVMAQADVIGALETEAQKQRLQTMLSLRSLIGAEQWKQLGFDRGAKRGLDEGDGRE